MPAGWAAAAVAAAGVVSGAMQADAASEAAGQQAESADKSINLQKQQLTATRQDNAQFLKTGTAGNRRLEQLLGLGSKAPSGGYQWNGQTYPDEAALRAAITANYYKESGGLDPNHPEVQRSIEGHMAGIMAQQPGEAPAPGAVESSPLLRKFTAEDLAADPVAQSGLKFGLDRGTEGINSRAVAGGMYDSGATLKALTQFGNDYGSTKANESYNRFTNDQSNIYNKLAGISGTGQVASGQVAAAGTSAANNISNDITGAGNARAAGIVGGANAWGNAAAGGAGAYANYESNKTLQALLKKQQPYANDPYYASYGSGGGDV